MGWVVALTVEFVEEWSQHSHRVRLLTDPQVTKRREQNRTNISMIASSYSESSEVHGRMGFMPSTSTSMKIHSFRKNTRL
jgi:cell shape-determining protein MreC